MHYDSDMHKMSGKVMLANISETIIATIMTINYILLSIFYLLNTAE